MSAAAHRPKTGQIAVPVDPARRPDVLLRRRTPDNHQVSAWWMIGGFLAVTATIVALMGLIPGG
jgi:hypothetical protein